MMNFSSIGPQLQNLHLHSRAILGSLCKSLSLFFVRFYRFIVYRVHPFWINLCYLVTFSSLGFWVLKGLNPPRTNSSIPGDLDLFFTAVSATTVSSMTAVEMEVFSNTQLWVLTFLMFIGGELFTSMVGLQFKRLNLVKPWKTGAKTDSISTMELGLVKSPVSDSEEMEYNSVKFLGFVVLGYLLLGHFLGAGLVSLYLELVSSARMVVENRGMKRLTFSVFTAVSTFGNCGFIPTNENLLVFRGNSGLLLLLIPFILSGNTLFPPCLRLLVWFLGKFVKNEESRYLLENSKGVGFLHWLPSLHSWLLAATVFGLLLLQFTVFCLMDWDSEGFKGMNDYQKSVGALFQIVNSRHAGETIVDFSTLSPATLVMLVVMMYLPSHTSFVSIKLDGEKLQTKCKKKAGGIKIMESLVFSRLFYVIFFIIIACITERKKMQEDPINFSALNIVLEVISAYANVGFSTGYGCKRKLKADENCVDKWYGFSGKWSDLGKFIVILAMLFGRLKKYSLITASYRAWKLPLT